MASDPPTIAGTEPVSAPYIIADPPANEHRIVTAVRTVISLVNSSNTMILGLYSRDVESIGAAAFGNNRNNS